MHRIPQALFLSTLAFVLGCQSLRYEVALTPHPEGMKRELTCWNLASSGDSKTVINFPQEELERIATHYPEASVPANLAQKHRFESTFAEKMPGDVGGAGRYSVIDGPFGSTSMYVERIRGNEDYTVGVSERLEAVDRLANHLVGWMKRELQGHDDLDSLTRFLDIELRRDLKNISLQIWSTSNDGSGDATAQARIGLYFIERDYFSAHQWMALAHAENADELWSDLIPKLLAAKSGMDSAEAFDFLADEEQAQESFKSYLASTAEYADAVSRHEADEDQDKPDPMDLILQDFLLAFLSSSGGRHSLQLTLHLDDEPIETNGVWDAEARRVVWEGKIGVLEGPKGSSPFFAHATWATPDVKTQTRRFGKVVLKGEAIKQYQDWHASLDHSQRQQWNAFIETLDGTDVWKRIRRFRFDGEPPVTDAPVTEHNDLAALPRNLIKNGLDEN